MCLDLPGGRRAARRDRAARLGQPPSGGHHLRGRPWHAVCALPCEPDAATMVPCKTTMSDFTSTANMDTSAIMPIAGEGILIAGGMRAILLQVAYPAIGQGVAEHSNFTDRAMDRLRATMTYVYCMVYGSAAEKEAVCAHVNRVHRAIHGQGYDARNPDLQLWVTATLYDTAVGLYQRWVAPLDPARQEVIYRQYRVLGVALQMHDAQWPADRAAFRAYWDGMLKQIQVTAAARRVCRDLFHPHRIPLWMRAAMPLNRLVTAGLLPAPLRAAYGLEWNAQRQRRFEAFSKVVRSAYPRLPVAIRQLPKTWYLHDMRMRLARSQSVSGARNGTNPSDALR